MSIIVLQGNVVVFFFSNLWNVSLWPPVLKTSNQVC